MLDRADASAVSRGARPAVEIWLSGTVNSGWPAAVAAALTPEAVAINRIVMAEAARFPNLAKLVHEQGWQRSNAAVAALLDQFVSNGQIKVEDTNVAADLFLSLVIGRQTRLAMLGIETDPEQIDQRVRAAVNLFLNGVRPRSNE